MSEADRPLTESSADGSSLARSCHAGAVGSVAVGDEDEPEEECCGQPDRTAAATPAHDSPTQSTMAVLISTALRAKG
jgi:hypothetical protein